MNGLIKFDMGRVRAWFSYERWVTDIYFVAKELEKNESISAVYNEEDCTLLVESIDDKYNSVDELVDIVNDIAQNLPTE